MKRKSFNIPGHAHYLTFSCYRKRQLLTEDRLCLWLTESLDNARTTHHFNLYAYVIMPEHVHLLIHPQDETYDISQILRRIKGPFSYRVSSWYQETLTNRLRFLSAKSASGKIQRFWQPGGGYDRNIHNYEALRKAIEYIEFNPVRRGLVLEPVDWRWSSALTRLGKEDIPLRIDLVSLNDRAVFERPIDLG